MASPYGRMTPQQIKAWQARVAQHPHQAYAAALAHKNGGGSSSTTSTGNKLTPAQAKQLVANQQIVAPGLTAGDLNKSVNAEANVKYGDAQRTLAGAPGRSADFFAQYQQVLKQAQAQQAQTNQAATEGVKSLQGGLDQAAKDQWAGQSAAMTADAAQRGASVDPKLADQAKNAAGIRGILTGSYGALLTGQGQNAATSLVQRGVNAKQAEGEQQTAAGNQLAGLLKDKGAFKSSVRQQLISDATKNYLNQVTADSLNSQRSADTALTNAKTQNQKTLTAFVQKYDRLPSSADPNSPQAKLDRYRLHYAQTHGGKFPGTATTPKTPAKPKGTGNTNPASGPGSLTKTREQDYLSQVHTIADYFKSPPVVNGQPLTPAEIVAMLQSGKNPLKKAIDPRVIQLGRAYASNGQRGLGPAAVKIAHSLGIHVGGNFTVLPKHKASSSIPGSRPATGDVPIG